LTETDTAVNIKSKMM